MRKLSFYLLAMLVSSTVIFSSFTKKPTDPTNSKNVNINEFEILVNYLESNGNFINTDAPAIIPADEVRKNLKNQKYYIIDIRSDSWFEYGHIKNAHNVKPADLLIYFETKISPADYDKIVLVCYSGQSAAYYTSLLRLAGYNNTYNMKWGMSSWRADFAEKSWEKNVSDKYKDKIETKENPVIPVDSEPVLNTGKSDGKDILRIRLGKAFATPYREHIVKCDDIFKDPQNYYIIDFRSKDRYDYGHIPGAVNFEPKGSLNATGLNAIPADKKVVVCSDTGQEAAYVVAYLSLLGYDTGNVAYGVNSFMNKALKAKKYDAFSKKSINMYPVVE